VKIFLTKDDSDIQLMVRDNGVGFDVKNNANIESMGISGMRERIQSLSGQFKIKSSTDCGTTVTCNVPCKSTVN
jgi:two-component system NarL family sensor kinase